MFCVGTPGVVCSFGKGWSSTIFKSLRVERLEVGRSMCGVTKGRWNCFCNHEIGGSNVWGVVGGGGNGIAEGGGVRRCNDGLRVMVTLVWSSYWSSRWLVLWGVI